MQSIFLVLNYIFAFGLYIYNNIIGKRCNVIPKIKKKCVDTFVETKESHVVDHVMAQVHLLKNDLFVCKHIC